MTDAGTGWERDRRTHFDEIAENYNKIRPEYPAELFADIFEYAGINTKNIKALEIGAGTGKATKHFLGAGCYVTAVEIGANMANFLQKSFKEYKGFNVIVSAFEETLLEEGSYDLIYAASAFHWVDAAIGCPKVHMLLKNGGICALLRYNFNIIPPEGEALCEDIQSIYDQYYYSYYTSNANRKTAKFSHKLLKEPSKILSGYGFEDLKAYGFGDIAMKFYDWTLTFDADGYIDFLNTMSDHRALPESNRRALYADVKNAIQAQGGHHKMDCIFQLYMGRKMQP